MLTEQSLQVMPKLRWNEELDNIVIKHIQNSPNNLSHAFEQSAIELNRSVKSVQGRYYTYIKDNYKVHVLASPMGAVMNIKNTPRPADATMDIKVEIVLEQVKKLNRSQQRMVYSQMFDLF